MAAQGRFTEGWKPRFATGEAAGPLTTFLDLLVRTSSDFMARPRDAAEMAEVVKFAAAQKWPVVARGGGTWAPGGAIPVGGGVLVETSEMASLEVDPDNLRATAGAGVPMKRFLTEVQAKGLDPGPYPLFGAASTVGSFLARGGWGLGSLRHGPLSARVLEMETVLGTGEVVQLDGPAALAVAGSEGHLGLTTRATLSLEPRPEEVRPLGFTFERAKELGEAMNRLHASALPLHSVLFGEARHYRWLLRERGEIGAPYMLNAVLAGPKAVLNKAEPRVNGLAGPGAKPAREAGNREWKAAFEPFRFPVDYFHPFRWPLLLPSDRLVDFVAGFRDLLARMKLHGSFTGAAVARGVLLVEAYPLIDLRRAFGTLFAIGLAKKLNDLALDLGGRPGGYGLFGTGHLEKLHGEMADPLADVKSQVAGPQLLRPRASAGMELLLRVKRGIDPKSVLNPGKVTSLWLYPGGLLPAKLPPAAMNLAMDALAMGRKLVKGEELLST